MKTSRTSAKVIESIKTLLLSDNITANKMGIISAQQYGWELCDIANFVIRSNIKKDGFELSVNFYGNEFSIHNSYANVGPKLLICVDGMMSIDYVKYNKECTYYHFNKAIKLLVKELTKTLSNDEERIRNHI